MNTARLQLDIDTATPHLIRASGELDYENCHQLNEAVQQAIARCDHCVDLALDGLDFVDSSGVKVLIVGAQDAQTLGCAVRIVSMTPQLDRVLTMVGVRQLFDIAALPLDHNPWEIGSAPNGQSTFLIPADIRSCCDGRDWICNYAHSIGFRSPILDDIRLAAGEALSNAVRHGDCVGDSIKIKCHETGDGLAVSLAYSSHCFDPDDVPVPNMDDPPCGGMGIHFMRLVMDKVHYEFNDGSITLTLEKRRGGD